MSKLIPPLVSTTPPPLSVADFDDNEDDEFGDFATASTSALDTTYGCEMFSIPNTPEHIPRKEALCSKEHLEIPVNEGDDFEDNALNFSNNTSDDERFEMNGDLVPSNSFNIDLAKGTRSIECCVNDKSEKFLNTRKDGFNNKKDIDEILENVILKTSVPETTILNNVELECSVQETFESETPNLEIENCEIPVFSLDEVKSVEGYTESNNSCSIDDDDVDESCEESFKDAFEPSPQPESPDIQNTRQDENFVQENDNFIEQIDPEAKNNRESTDPVEYNHIEAALTMEAQKKSPVWNIIPENKLVVNIDCKTNDKLEENQCTSTKDKDNVHLAQNLEPEGILDPLTDHQHIPKSSAHIDDDDDFADFTSATCQLPNLKLPTSETTSQPLEVDEDDDFGDFATATSETTVPNVDKSQHVDEDDDFGDFACNTTEIPTKYTINSEKVLEKAQTLLLNMFPSCPESITEDFVAFDFITGDKLIKEIQDITDTNALTYQWSKSQAQKELLKALNIDVRNILYGGCNSMLMPKYACNLRASPLEPVKSVTVVSSVSDQQQQQSPTVQNDEVPSVQFDWSEAGLANPLDDYLEQIVASLEFTHTKHVCSTANYTNHAAASAAVELEEWVDSWMMSPTPKELDTKVDMGEYVKSEALDADSVSVSSLHFTEMFPEVLDAASKDSLPDLSAGLKHVTIPLRETYIADVNTEINAYHSLAKDTFNKSTCNSTIAARTSTDVMEQEKQQQSETVSEEDEFTDFQAIAPCKSSTAVLSPDKQHESHTLTCLEPVKLNTETLPQNIWPDPGISQDELERLSAYYSNKENSKNGETKHSVSSDAKLSGAGGSVMVEKSIVLPADKVILSRNEIMLPPQNKVVISKDLILPILDSSPRKYAPHKQSSEVKSPESKNSVADDDEWSDFVSSKATPGGRKQELSLSIHQLNHLQPQKAPIPVITPRGLLQTKIPSSATILKPTSPIRHASVSNNILNNCTNPGPLNDGYQPAIISNHYASHMNQQSAFFNFPSVKSHATGYQSTSPQATSSYKHQEVMATNGPNTSPHHQLNGFHDDKDEWSEFMSSQPISTPNSIYNLGATNLNSSPARPPFYDAKPYYQSNSNHQFEVKSKHTREVGVKGGKLEASPNGFAVPKNPANFQFFTSHSNETSFPDMDFVNMPRSNSGRPKK